jgi:hypothetical protein
VITKLLTVFDVFENEQEAVDSFRDDFETAPTEVTTGRLDEALTA